MRISNWIRVGLFSVLAVAGWAGETAVTLAPDLKGAWVEPAKEWDGRTVVLLHGFASDMDDAGGLLKRLAHELAAKGIASLRINFRGEGDPKRTKIGSTFATRLEDTAAAFAFAGGKPGVSAARVGVLGWSLGASTAIETGARHPEWFKSMALWSSPSGDQFALMSRGFQAAFDQAEREGTGSAEIPGWKTVTLRKSFFDSFRGINVDLSLAKYPGAFLSVRGAQDYLPHHDDEFVRIAPGRPAEAVLIGGGDHVFNVFDPSAPQPARVLELTVSWFERTL